MPPKRKISSHNEENNNGSSSSVAAEVGGSSSNRVRITMTFSTLQKLVDRVNQCETGNGQQYQVVHSLKEQQAAKGTSHCIHVHHVSAGKYPKATLYVPTIDIATVLAPVLNLHMEHPPLLSGRGKTSLHATPLELTIAQHLMEAMATPTIRLLWADHIAPVVRQLKSFSYVSPRANEATTDNDGSNEEEEEDCNDKEKMTMRSPLNNNDIKAALNKLSKANALYLSQVLGQGAAGRTTTLPYKEQVGELLSTSTTNALKELLLTTKQKRKRSSSGQSNPNQPAISPTPAAGSEVDLFAIEAPTTAADTQRTVASRQLCITFKRSLSNRQQQRQWGQWLSRRQYLPKVAHPPLSASGKRSLLSDEKLMLNACRQARPQGGIHFLAVEVLPQAAEPYLSTPSVPLCCVWKEYPAEQQQSTTSKRTRGSKSQQRSPTNPNLFCVRESHGVDMGFTWSLNGQPVITKHWVQILRGQDFFTTANSSGGENNDGAVSQQLVGLVQRNNAHSIVSPPPSAVALAYLEEGGDGALIAHPCDTAFEPTTLGLSGQPSLQPDEFSCCFCPKEGFNHTVVFYDTTSHRWRTDPTIPQLRHVDTATNFRGALTAGAGQKKEHHGITTSFNYYSVAPFFKNATQATRSSIAAHRDAVVAACKEGFTTQQAAFITASTRLAPPAPGRPFGLLQQPSNQHKSAAESIVGCLDIGHQQHVVTTPQGREAQDEHCAVRGKHDAPTLYPRMDCRREFAEPVEASRALPPLRYQVEVLKIPLQNGEDAVVKLPPESAAPRRGRGRPPTKRPVESKAEEAARAKSPNGKAAGQPEKVVQPSRKAKKHDSMTLLQAPPPKKSGGKAPTKGLMLRSTPTKGNVCKPKQPAAVVAKAREETAKNNQHKKKPRRGGGSSSETSLERSFKTDVLEIQRMCDLHDELAIENNGDDGEDGTTAGGEGGALVSSPTQPAGDPQLTSTYELTATPQPVMQSSPLSSTQSASSSLSESTSAPTSSSTSNTSSSSVDTSDSDCSTFDSYATPPPLPQQPPVINSSPFDLQAEMMKKLKPGPDSAKKRYSQVKAAQEQKDVVRARGRTVYAKPGEPNLLPTAPGATASQVAPSSAKPIIPAPETPMPKLSKTSPPVRKNYLMPLLKPATIQQPHMFGAGQLPTATATSGTLSPFDNIVEELIPSTSTRTTKRHPKPKSKPAAPQSKRSGVLSLALSAASKPSESAKE